ncbi:MAG: hypothetical protein H0X30_19850, partial [Anaerolineae bacterium]|nr:hypothetical protein [Anaerolineae bacterium]
MRKYFTLKRIMLYIIVAMLALVVGFIAWANDALQPMPEALAALQSDAQVEVSQPNGWYVFTPTATKPTTG